MPVAPVRIDRPGEKNGRPQLTLEGWQLIGDRVRDIRDRRLPEMRPLLVEHERDERHVAEFERLIEESARLAQFLCDSEVIAVDPLDIDGRLVLGMRARVSLADGSEAWVRPVHPQEAFLDDERISVTSPLAVALMGSRVGHTVWVGAPSGTWSCTVLEIDAQGVTARP